MLMQPFRIPLPATLVAGALAFIAASVAAILLGRNLNVGQFAQTISMMMRTGFHATVDALVVLMSHDETPPDVFVTDS